MSDDNKKVNENDTKTGVDNTASSEAEVKKDSVTTNEQANPVNSTETDKTDSVSEAVTNEEVDNKTDEKKDAESSVSAENNEESSAANSESQEGSRAFPIKPYLVAVVVIAIMGVVLLFALEQQGRVQTGLFGNASSLFAGPAAKVNGVAISQEDFDRNFEQVLREVEAQGFAGDLAPEMESTLREQAVQSLINAELLKQAAEASGVSVSAEEIEARMAEIESGNGGAEELAARMAEFGITMEQLQTDIEREILIQNHLNNELDLENIAVTDEELEQTYTEISEANAGTEIPPLEEIRDVLYNQLLSEKQQQVVGEYIDGLRAEADIEINV